MKTDHKSGETPMPEASEANPTLQTSKRENTSSQDLPQPNDEDKNVASSAISRTAWIGAFLIICMLIGGSAYLFVSVPEQEKDIQTIPEASPAPPPLPLPEPPTPDKTGGMFLNDPFQSSTSVIPSMSTSSATRGE